MLALKSFARSTFGELKDALIDEVDDEEEEDGERRAAPGAGAPASSPDGSEGLAPFREHSHAVDLDRAEQVAAAPAAPLLRVAPAEQPCSAAGCPGAREAAAAPAGSWLALASPTPGHQAPVTPGPRRIEAAPAEGWTPNGRGAAAEVEPAMPARPVAPEASEETAGGSTLVAAPAPDGDLLAALQGGAAEPTSRLCDEAAEARRRFAALLGTPGLVELLGACPELHGGPVLWGSAGDPSVPRIAAQCAEALRLLAPRVLAAEHGGKAQHLLAAASERYGALLTQCDAAQRRCQHMEAEQRGSREELARKLEDLAVENADLKERIKVLHVQRAEPDDRPQLLRSLAQREAELRGLQGALQRLQEVLDDTTTATGARCTELERELQAARRCAAEAEAARMAQAAGLREAQEAAEAAAAREAALAARCLAAEREAREGVAALDVLLQEKGRHMEEREHFVDRRLVTSTIALCLDHLDSGQRSLAEQTLSQTLQVLGGESAMAERQRIRSAAAAAEERLAGPLGDAFLDFLTREAAEDDVVGEALNSSSGPGDAAAANVAGTP